MKGASQDSKASRMRPQQQPRRRTPAPPRLQWPAISAASAPASQQASQTAAVVPEPSVATSGKRPAPLSASTAPSLPPSTSANAHRKNPHKRTRRLTAPTAAAGGADPMPPLADPRLWTDAHAPAALDDVCVAPKKVREIRHWLLEGGPGGGSGLLVLVGGPGIGKSTAVRCLAAELGRPLLEWTESVASSQYDRLAAPDLAQTSPLAALESFLRQARAGYAMIPTAPPSAAQRSRSNPAHDNQAGHPPQGPPLILLDELPNLHGREMEERFRNLFTQHAIESSSSGPGQHRTPTVWIWSNVAEGKHHKEDLERLVEPRVLYDPQYCQILPIHPPTQSRFAKVVNRIAAQRGVTGQQVDAAALYAACGGDLRFAITSLQMEGSTTGGVRGPNSKPSTNGRRDERLNPFHALGKLLYAKRKPARSNATLFPTGSRWCDERPPLEFDPDSVLDRCEMELPRALQFLEYHAVDFMIDLAEVSQVLSCYSDAAWLCERRSASHNDGTAQHRQGTPPTHPAAALAARAAAVHNRHPAPARFRQFGAPRIFEVLRKRSTNQAQLRHALSQSTRLLGADQFATDCLSLVWRIRPDHQLPWQSYLAPSSSGDEIAPLPFESESQGQLVLDDDDINEFSDQDDDPDARTTGVLPRPWLQFNLPKAAAISPSLEEATTTSPTSTASSPPLSMSKCALAKL